MNPRIIKVEPRDNYFLLLTFENREKKLFDVKPYLSTGLFKELKNKKYFSTVKSFLGSISWKNGQDLCPDTLYMESKKVS